MMKQRLVISQKCPDKSHFFFLIVKKRVSKEQACKGIYKPKTNRQHHASLPSCLVKKKYHVTHYWLHFPSAGLFVCLWFHIHAKPTLSIRDCKFTIVLLTKHKCNSFMKEAKVPQQEIATAKVV